MLFTGQPVLGLAVGFGTGPPDAFGSEFVKGKDRGREHASEEASLRWFKLHEAGEHG